MFNAETIRNRRQENRMKEIVEGLWYQLDRFERERVDNQNCPLDVRIINK